MNHDELVRKVAYVFGDPDKQAELLLEHMLRNTEVSQHKLLLAAMTPARRQMLCDQACAASCAAYEQLTTEELEAIVKFLETSAGRAYIAASKKQAIEIGNMAPQVFQAVCNWFDEEVQKGEES